MLTALVLAIGAQWAGAILLVPAFFEGLG